MADDVIITGLNGVPAWATEDTLTRIHDVLKKTLGIQKAASTQGGGAKSLDDSLDDIAKAMAAHNKKLRESNELTEQDLIYKRRAEAINEKFGSAQALLATTLAASVKVFDAMKASMINNVQTFDKMNSAGVLAAGTINGQDDVFKNLGNMAMLASLRAEKLADVLTKYTGANAVGSIKFAKALNTAQPGLMALGFNSEAAAEVMGAYLDTVAGTRDIQELSGVEIAAGTERFAKNMTRISLALGVSREKLMQQTAAINSSVEANAVAAEYGDEAAEKMSMFAASFKDPAIGDAFVKMVASKMPVLNSTFQSFAKSGLGGLGMQITNFYKSLIGLDPLEAQKRSREFLKTLGDLDPIINRQKFLAEAGVEGADETLKMLIGLRQQQTLDKKMGEEDFQQQQRAAAASAKIATQWESIKASLQKIFAPSATLLEFLGTGLEHLAKVVESTANFFGKVDKEVKQFLGNYGVVLEDATASLITLVAAIGGLIGAVKTLKYLFQMWKTAGAVKDAIVGGKAAGNVAGTVAGGAGATVGKAGAGLGGILGGLGKGLGELLKGVGAGGGKLIEGLLTGISKGVSAFASPKFVLGSAMLSAGIAVLSLGLGAAAFVMGKTLPILSEGLRSFSDIDGSNLIDVGKGLIGLSAGLALFGVGGIVAGAGTVMSSIIESVGGLFGAKSPLEKIKEFASIGPELSLAGSGMASLADGLNNFASVDNSALKSNVDSINKLRDSGGITAMFKTLGTGDLGGVLSSLGKGIGEFFRSVGTGSVETIDAALTGIANGLKALASPLVFAGSLMSTMLPTLSGGLRTFSDIDGANLADVGKGLSALSGGLALFGPSSAAASAGGVISGIIDRVGSLFGVSGPLDKVKEFASIGDEISLAGSGMTALAAGLHSFASVNNSALKANVDAVNKIRDSAGSMIDKTKSNIDAVNKMRAFGGNMSWFKTPQASRISGNAPEKTSEAGDSRKPLRGEEPMTEKNTPTTVKAAGSGFEQPAADSGINTLLAQQVSLTSMVLAKLDSSLSVSKDILKYTKLQT